MATTVLTDALVILSTDQHGRVETSDAVALEGNRIVAVGGAARAMIDLPDTTHIDATGRTIIPGVGDGHAHPIFAGLELLGPEIRSGRTPVDIASSVKKFADANPDIEWIVGGSYDSSIIPGGLFDATWLDSIDRPVVLNAWDYHTVWVNSEALRRAGITSETPEPELGRIIRRPDGTPMGTLQEYGAIDLVKAVMPADNAERLALALKKASDHFIELGVTWVQDAWVDHQHVDGYLEAASKGFIRNRFNLALRA
ncbi:MAG: amidohydrolase family protein, partial [Microbacteriaceae bacterium]